MKRYYIIFSLAIGAGHLFAELPAIDVFPFHALLSETVDLKPGPLLPGVHNSIRIPIERLKNKSKTASVIIPCHFPHAKHLYTLLRSFEEQTVLPDEVVISLSEYTKVPQDIMHVLEESTWAFPVTVVLSEQKLYSAQNRNLASSLARGDIFIYNDADDLSHPQRIEIIKYCFGLYGLDMLIHGFVHLQEEADVAHVHYDDLEVFCPFDYHEIPGRNLHNGNTAISRNVFDAFKWPDFRSHEDEFYNRILYKYFGKRLAVRAPLIVYRNYLSCGYQHNLDPNGNRVEVSGNKNMSKQHAMRFIHNTLIYQE